MDETLWSFTVTVTLIDLSSVVGDTVCFELALSMCMQRSALSFMASRGGFPQSLVAHVGTWPCCTRRVNVHMSGAVKAVDGTVISHKMEYSGGMRMTHQGQHAPYVF